MAGDLIDPEIAQAFGCSGTNQELSGGEGRSLRFGECVLKPVENPQRYSWACELLLRLPGYGYRIVTPLKARDGSYVYKGWGASKYEPGEHVSGRWAEKLELLRLFHLELNEIKHAAMPPGDDIWSRAQEMAWQQAPIPSTLPIKILGKIEGLYSQYQPLSRVDGIIHADLCGNILFHETLNPCIIDFSPAYGSIAYAEAILVVDAIAWERAPLDILRLLPPTEHTRQYLLRAVSFRLLVMALFAGNRLRLFFGEYDHFEPLIKWIIG